MDMCVSHFGYKMMLCGYEAADILYVCMNTCICNVPCDADVDDDVLRWPCSVNFSHYRQKSQPESSFVSIAPLYQLNPTEYKHLSGNYR